MPQPVTNSFLPAPTVYDVVTVTGVVLTLSILLYQWYLDNSAPLRIKLGFSPGVSPVHYRHQCIRSLQHRWKESWSRSTQDSSPNRKEG